MTFFPPAPPQGRQRRELLFFLAQAYLAGWGYFGIYNAFIVSVWWHYLNPALLGISLFALTVTSCLIFIAPTAFEIRTLLRHSVRHFWIFQGILPAFCSCMPEIQLQCFIAVMRRHVRAQKAGCLPMLRAVCTHSMKDSIAPQKTAGSLSSGFHHSDWTPLSAPSPELARPWPRVDCS